MADTDRATDPTSVSMRCPDVVGVVRADRCGTKVTPRSRGLRPTFPVAAAALGAEVAIAVHPLVDRTPDRLDVPDLHVLAGLMDKIRADPLCDVAHVQRLALRQDLPDLLDDAKPERSKSGWAVLSQSYQDSGLQNNVRLQAGAETR